MRLNLYVFCTNLYTRFEISVPKDVEKRLGNHNGVMDIATARFDLFLNGPLKTSVIKKPNANHVQILCDINVLTSHKHHHVSPKI